MPKAATAKTETSPTDRARRSAGYTLLELVVVLVVAALAAAVIAPRLFSGDESVGARTAGLNLATALRRARADAIKFNRETVLRIDANAATLTTGDGSAAGTVADGFAIRLLIAEGERTGDASGGIRFFPDGSSTGGRVTLSRDGADGEPDVVVGVDWLTGRVEVKD